MFESTFLIINDICVYFVSLLHLNYLPSSHEKYVSGGHRLLLEATLKCDRQLVFIERIIYTVQCCSEVDSVQMFADSDGNIDSLDPFTMSTTSVSMTS